MVPACPTPPTGVRPPFFTLVAVRAIAPVAGIPPNRGATMFATPCATSSMFERWRPPIMPSATTAERSDSIAPSRAIVNAGARSPGSCGGVTAGRAGAGRAALIAPKREPIVSTRKRRSRTLAPPAAPSPSLGGGRPAYQAVGRDRREERLDRAEQGDRERRR